MTVASTRSVFASVERHFNDPRTADVVRLTVVTDETTPIQLTPVQARNILHGPDRNPALATPVWRAVVRAAAAEQGPSDTWRLLLVWLALPRLTGTVFRICRRLRAERTDVEAEMVLALLECLQYHEEPTAESMDDLLKSARTRAWRFARSGAHETADDTMERLPADRVPPCNGPEIAEEILSRQVEVTRHEQADGLRALMRFTVSPETLGRRVRNALMETAERGGAVCPTRDVERRRRVPGDARRCAGRHR